MVLFVSLFRNERVPVVELNLSGSGIVLPVRAAISNHHSLKIRCELARAKMDLIEMVDLIYQIRHVNTSVRLSSDVKFIGLVLWVLFIPRQNNLKIVLCDIVVIKHAFILMVFVITVRVPNASWLLDVENRGFSVPWVFVNFQFSSSVILLIRSIFLHESLHRWAPRATIEPNNQRISRWVLLAFNKEVMDLFWSILYRAKVTLHCLPWTTRSNNEVIPKGLTISSTPTPNTSTQQMHSTSYATSSIQPIWNCRPFKPNA